MSLLLLLVIAMAQPPADANGWFALGESRYAAGDFRGAAEAYERAWDLGYVPRVKARIRLLRAYAHSDREKAFGVLDQMAHNGFGATNILNADDELVSLRSDPRWKVALAEMDRTSRPCRNAPEFRQFDYWLGEWDVESGGQQIAQSSIQLILDDCVIFENYVDFRGYAGKSFSIYDAAHKRWEQRYVDTGDSFHEWTGGLQDGVMTFRWDHDGSLNRMTYTKEGPDRVRQILETSTDGKSWTKTYDGLYVRRR